MTGAPLLSVEGLSKKYCRGASRDFRYAVADVVGELTPWRARNVALRRDEFWVLDDVSFTLNAGEAMAIVGRNGAGKTTLLKLLLGLIKPDRGAIRRRGSIEAVLELGTGFNPILTGRENLELGAAMSGRRGASARRLLDEVVAFAELEEAIDTPVQTYSSGMRARLGFALSAHLDPDILLIDEALSVGDASFQRKCVTRIRDYVEAGGAMLFVSHSAFQVQTVCQHGLLLEGGRATFQGSAIEALNRMFEAGTHAPGSSDHGASDEPVRIVSIVAEAPGGGMPVTDEPADIVLTYDSTMSGRAIWGFVLMSADQWVCITGAFDERPVEIAPGPGVFRARVERFPLLPGSYVLRGAICDAETMVPWGTLGWNEGGEAVSVKGHPTRILNTQAQLSQLVRLDVQW